jgi:hypothetical protein
LRHSLVIDEHFAETAIVDYHLSFDDQGKQTSVFYFRFAANKGKFAISVCHLQQTNRILLLSISFVYHTYIYIETAAYIYIFFNAAN